MCIKEGLRLYSPVHTIQREILEDLDVKGMTVPKGNAFLSAILCACLEKWKKKSL